MASQSWAKAVLEVIRRTMDVARPLAKVWAMKVKKILWRKRLKVGVWKKLSRKGTKSQSTNA